MKKALLSLLSIALLLVWNTASAAVTVTDVTNGSEIRGVTTPADAAGFAKVAWDGSTFNLHGGFTGLSDPRWDDFYEGWLVRQSPFAFISTGELEKIDGEYHDFFNSSIDYREYDFYVLTLEPNDGNDAPADHILEWATTLVDASVFAEKAETSEKTEVKTKVTTNLKTAPKVNSSSTTPPITIVDVTNWVEFRGITTSADASGFGKVAWDGSTFNLHSVFTGLSDPRGDDFYEGWLVRQTPFAFISTGVLEKDAEGAYHNIWSSSTDYSDYSLYVLTLEPNDGNDAPADHILEGPVTLVDASAFAKKEVTTAHTNNTFTARQESIAQRAEVILSTLSSSQKADLLERVLELQDRVSTLNISEATKVSYNEILEVLAVILSK